MKVFLADDDILLRVGLRLAFNHRQDVEVIGEAGDGLSAVEKIRADTPDISLIDIDMPILSGIEVIRVVRKVSSHMKIIALSNHANQDCVKKALEAGANAYVPKSIEVDELFSIMEAFHRGLPITSPYLLGVV